MILRSLPRILTVIMASLLWTACAAMAQEATGWTASAGMVPIGEDPERPDAEIFDVDYIREGADPATRPVTFLVNGGPGGASIFLHIAAIGPLTIASPGDGSFPAVPAKLEPNPDSWIDFTDLVFIDPVGTGYGRILPGPDGQLFPTKFVLEQSLVNPEARKRLLFGVYPGGHMFYLQKASRAEFAADVRAFYAGAN